MIGRKDMKQETMAKRVRNRAVAKKMMSPRKKMDMGMSPGAGMGAASAPMMPMGMKKGGKVDFSKIVQNKKTGKLSEKAAGFSKGGMAKAFSGVPAEMAKKMSGMKSSGKAKTYEGVPPAAAKFAGMKKAAGFSKGGMAKKGMKGMKGGGMMLIIGLGKKKGK